MQMGVKGMNGFMTAWSHVLYLMFNCIGSVLVLFIDSCDPARR